MAATQLRRQYGISGSCYDQRKSEFDGMSASTLKRKRALNGEDVELERRSEDLAPENGALRKHESKKGSEADRAAVDYVIAAYTRLLLGARDPARLCWTSR